MFIRVISICLIQIFGGHAAAQMPRIRKCFGCGSTGHRIERCPTRAGAEIRKLRELVRTQQAVSKPGRYVRPRKNRKVLKHATKEYTKKRTKICAEAGRTSREPAEKDMILRVKQALPSLETSWDLLLALGFCRKPIACLACGAKKLEPSSKVERGAVVNLIVRCGERCCRSETNVIHYGPFRFLRMNPQELLEVLQCYASLPRDKQPCPRHIHRMTGLGRHRIASVCSTLRAMEAKAGRESSKNVVLEGDIEGDATSVRKTFIAGRNKHYADLVQKIRRKHPPVQGQPEVYRMDIRAVGICVRGGQMAMVFLPPRLVQKSSVPPMETTEEVLQSNLLDQIPKRRKVILFSDGAGAWPAALTKKNMKFTHNEQVVHCKKQFVAYVQKPVRGHSKVAGTMSIDSRWGHVKTWLPRQLHTKQHGGSKTGSLNPEIEETAFAWLWRHNEPCQTSFIAALGKLCRKEICR